MLSSSAIAMNAAGFEVDRIADYFGVDRDEVDVILTPDISDPPDLLELPRWEMAVSVFREWTWLILFSRCFDAKVQADKCGFSDSALAEIDWAESEFGRLCREAGEEHDRIAFGYTDRDDAVDPERLIAILAGMDEAYLRLRIDSTKTPIEELRRTVPKGAAFKEFRDGYYRRMGVEPPDEVHQTAKISDEDAQTARDVIARRWEPE